MPEIFTNTPKSAITNGPCQTGPDQLFLAIVQIDAAMCTHYLTQMRIFLLVAIQWRTLQEMHHAGRCGGSMTIFNRQSPIRTQLRVQGRSFQFSVFSWAEDGSACICLTEN